MSSIYQQAGIYSTPRYTPQSLSLFLNIFCQQLNLFKPSKHFGSTELYTGHVNILPS